MATTHSTELMRFSVFLLVALGACASHSVPRGASRALEAFVAKDYAMFRYHIPRQSVWEWYRPRDANFAYEWSAGWIAGHQVYEVAWWVLADSTGKSGSLAELVNAGSGGRARYASCGDIPCVGHHPEPAVSVGVRDTIVTLRVGPSQWLAELWEQRPDSIQLGLRLNGKASRRSVALTYAR